MDKENTSDAKQQISERIKEVSNILVTVSKNPTVDELSAALGLTLMLNKADKHATAVFSGAIPPAIEFLEPGKTLENNVDSLRDFIIAIDKEKADRLRYKVEGDVVRIFITPYRTNISQEDLEFTHGDFNVELVLALGVENQEVLDEAIAAHGKILHDATVATINAQNKTSNLGSIDWRDENASSLSEMLVTLGEAFGESALDEQIATALLTGIVAATDRFSNSQTSSKSMTIAAQLMAAGANQQLIASKLESASEISVSGSPQADGSVKLDEGKSGKLQNVDTPQEHALGQIQIDHGQKENAELPQVESKTIEEHDKTNKKNAGEEALDAALEKLGTTKEEKSTEALHAELESAAKKVDRPRSPLIGHSKPAGSWGDPTMEEPTMGGAINATAQDVSEKKKHDEEESRNKTILSHDGGASSTQGKTIERESPVLPTAVEPDQQVPTVMDIQVTNNEPKAQGTLADIEADVGAHRATSASLPPVPPPPLPDFSSLPPLPPTTPANFEPSAAPTPSAIPPPQTTAAPANTPDQFKIPGQ